MVDLEQLAAKAKAIDSSVPVELIAKLFELNVLAALVIKLFELESYGPSMLYPCLVLCHEETENFEVKTAIFKQVRPLAQRKRSQLVAKPVLHELKLELNPIQPFFDVIFLEELLVFQ
jgi:hypothetical protein